MPFKLVPAYRTQTVKFKAPAPKTPVTGPDYHGKQVKAVVIPHIEDKVPLPHEISIFFHDGSTDVFTTLGSGKGLIGPDGKQARMLGEGPWQVVRRTEDQAS